jgi:hypothetical protein
VRWHVPHTEADKLALVEKHIRLAVTFEAGGKEISWKQTLTFEESSESKDGREHVIYRSFIMVDGVRKNILAIKAAMKHLARNVPDAMRKTARLVQEGVL